MNVEGSGSNESERMQDRGNTKTSVDRECGKMNGKREIYTTNLEYTLTKE